MTRRKLLELAAVAALLVIAVAIRFESLDQALVEAHGFRQTQTAYQALEFKQHGIDLLHPKLPVLGKPFEVPFEFPAFEALATIPMNLGVEPDTAMRVTGLGCFLLTACLLFGLLRRVGGRIVAFGALVTFLFSPFGILWSRTSMMEYLATAGAVGFAWAGIEWRESRRWPLLAIAIVAGALAMTVKVTTAVFWILPLVLYTSRHELPGIRDWIRARVQPAMLALVGVPLLAGVVWTRHADAIKAANPATNFLTSASLTAWNFGTLDQRTVSANWLTIFDRVETLLVGRYIWIGLVLVAVWAARRQLFWVGMLLAAVLPPVVFFNLYVVHEYYLAAVSPAIAALLGLGAQWLWTHRPRRMPTRIFAIALAALWLAWLIWPNAGYLNLIYENAHTPFTDSALEIAKATPEDALVIVQGESWDPTALYYSRRQGLMLDDHLPPSVVRALPSQGYNYLFTLDPQTYSLEVVREWPWVGVIGPRMYMLGHDLNTVLAAPVIAHTVSTDATDVGGADTSEVSVPCDGSRIAVGGKGTKVRISMHGPPQDGMRLWLKDDLGPLPWVPTIATSGQLQLRCAGAAKLDLSVSITPK